MKNSEYWESRIANNIWTTYNNLEERNRALLEMYQEASLSISDELYRVGEKLKSSKPMLSDMHKFNRLSGLQKNMEKIIRNLGENVESFGKKGMFQGFKDVYSNVMLELGALEFDMVPEKVMKEMLDRPWFGSNFSTRLWKNTQILANNLNDILTNGLTQGKTVTEMAIEINNRMNEGFNVSHRLIRTETMHYLNESAFKGYVDGGCEEVEVWAALDERVCPKCGKKHGKKYKVDKRPILPLHAHCRCTYLPVIDVEEKKDSILKITNWNEYKSNDTEFKTKKEISKYITNKYNMKFSDSKKYPIDKDILQDCVNWLDKFHGYFEGFKAIDPVELPAFKVKAGIKSVGYYSYYLNTPKAEELVLNGAYFNNKEYNIEYIKKCIESKWTVANAKGHKTFVHEYGHHIANSLRWIENKELNSDKWCEEFIEYVLKEYNEKYDKQCSFKDVPELVSRYGGKKPAETFAEAFAEYFGGDNPRDFAKVFGEEVEKRLKEYIKLKG